MPVWGPKPDESLKDDLDQVWSDLEKEITTNPTFDQVVGLPLEKMVDHADKAISFMASKGGGSSLTPAQKAAGIQLYCLGFVVGTKYGERRYKSTIDKDAP